MVSKIVRSVPDLAVFAQLAHSAARSRHSRADIAHLSLIPPGIENSNADGLFPVTRTNRLCSAYSEKAPQTFGSARRRPLRKIVDLRLVRRFHQGGGIIYLSARGLNSRIETCPAIIGLNFGQTTLRPDQHGRVSYRQWSMAHNAEFWPSLKPMPKRFSGSAPEHIRYVRRNLR
jgi:hypothetical protein